MYYSECELVKRGGAEFKLTNIFLTWVTKQMQKYFWTSLDTVLSNI